jgi:hypothetical protein
MVYKGERPANHPVNKVSAIILVPKKTAKAPSTKK